YPNLPPNDVALGQIGLVPLNAKSIQWKASNELGLSVQGQAIPVVQIGLGPNYTLWGANISQFAGQTVDLRISTLQTPQRLFYTRSLDDIGFSSVAIPEPGVAALTALGMVLLSLRLTEWFNNSMKANRRCNFALVASRKFGRVVHATRLFSAAVAYFCR